MARKRILIADDDRSILNLVGAYLREEGYEPILANNGQDALHSIGGENPALAILDIRMPGLDGLEVCRRIRASSDLPIIMLTANARDEDVRHGLDSGADDYVTKPFNPEVLLARIRAVLRRTKFLKEMAHPPFRFGDLVIDFEQHRVTVAGREVRLTATEYKLLSVLARNAGRVLTKDQLLEKVWGVEYLGESDLLWVAFSRLREKLEEDPRNPKYIITKVGIGYTIPGPT